jgi:hypothetical protein
VVAEISDGTILLMQSPVFSRVESTFEIPVDARLHLDDEAAQQLMNDLWTAGFRPTYGQDSKPIDQAIKAMESHIEDLRGITFHLLGGKK